MKTRFNCFTIGLVAIAFVEFTAPTAQAQTSTNTPVTGAVTTTTNLPVVNSIPSFFNQALNWASSFNTNYCWTNYMGQFEDGLAQQNGTGASDYIRGQYNFGKWSVIGEGDFFGTGSAFNSAYAGGGYAFIEKYDFKTEFNVLVGGTKIDTSSDAMKFSAFPELKISKLMTANTYMTAGLGVPYVQSKKFDGTPTFRIAFGFTF